MTWTLTTDHRRISTDPNDDGDARKAHPAYTVVDPLSVARKLSEAGLATTLLTRAQSRHLAPRTALLEVVDPRLARTHDDYHAAARVYFDHRGRSSILIEAGAVRVACRNSFTHQALRIHHCSATAKVFRDNPVPFLINLVRDHAKMADRLEQLRGRRGGLNLALFVRSRAPRLGACVLRDFEAYTRQDGPTVWSALQALTQSKRPRLERFAGACVLAPGGFGALWAGDVPAWLWN